MRLNLYILLIVVVFSGCRNEDIATEVGVVGCLPMDGPFDLLMTNLETEQTYTIAVNAQRGFRMEEMPQGVYRIQAEQTRNDMPLFRIDQNIHFPSSIHDGVLNIMGSIGVYRNYLNISEPLVVIQADIWACDRSDSLKLYSSSERSFDPSPKHLVSDGFVGSLIDTIPNPEIGEVIYALVERYRGRSSTFSELIEIQHAEFTTSKRDIKNNKDTIINVPNDSALWINMNVKRNVFYTLFWTDADELLSVSGNNISVSLYGNENPITYFESVLMDENQITPIHFRAQEDGRVKFKFDLDNTGVAGGIKIRCQEYPYQPQMLRHGNTHLGASSTSIHDNTLMPGTYKLEGTFPERNSEFLTFSIYNTDNEKPLVERAVLFESDSSFIYTLEVPHEQIYTFAWTVGNIDTDRIVVRAKLQSQ